MATELLAGIVVEPVLNVALEIVSVPSSAFADPAQAAVELVETLGLQPWGPPLARDAVPAALAGLVFDAVAPGRQVGQRVMQALGAQGGPWLERLTWAEWPFPRNLEGRDTEGLFRGFIDDTVVGQHVITRNSPPKENSLDKVAYGAVATAAAGAPAILVASHVAGIGLLVVAGPVVLVCGVAGGAAVAITRFLIRKAG